MKIIILHGLYMHGLVMQPLSHKLRKLGYQTQVLTYNTVAIDKQRVFQKIDSALSPDQTNILVGHSLGGLIIKAYLHERHASLETISHVVAIGSPIRGASIVERMQQLGIGAMLGNSPQHGLNLHDGLWCVPQKLGCIAGTVPLGARALFGMDQSMLSDGTVTVEETKIEGMTDHILSPSTHTSLIYNSFVPKQIDYFVKHNSFEHLN